MTAMRPLSHAFGLLLGTAMTAAAQAVPTRTLTTPTAEWSEPFSQISGIRELKNGRVIVADSRDKVLQLVDLAGEARKIGREGSGPGEYGLPMSVFAAPGDTTWVYDALNSRYLVIDPAGKPVSTFMMLDAAPAAAAGPAQSGRGGAPRLGLGFAQGVDALGRLYFRAPSVSIGSSGPAVSDTMPIIRWDRRKNAFDTVGVLVNPPSPPPQRSTGGGRDEVRVTVRIGGAQPFGSADTYVVTPAGDVAVVRARDYHVEWIVNGKTLAGAPIKYDRVRVTDADKRQWNEMRRNATSVMVTNDNGNRSVRSMPAAPDGETTFPEFKGPFGSNAVASPNGQVLVPRYMPFGAPPTYDVIDRTGKVVSRLVLPQKTRLLGFGNETVYLARSDDDDLQYLQRYKW